MSAADLKNPILIPASIYTMLDPFHRAAAEVLQDRGLAIIEKDGGKEQW